MPDAFCYMRAFFPTYWQGRKGIKVKFGPAFFASLHTPKRWRLDQPSPFEAVRVLDPEPDQDVLEEALANLKRAYPALRRILKSYASYYNEARTHLSLGKDPPIGRSVQRLGEITALSILGGLHHHYCRI